MRYVLGAALGILTVEAAKSPSLEDVIGKPVSWDAKAVVLDFPPIDIATQQHPGETRVYLLPEGFDVPKTADDWIASGLPYGQSTEVIDPAGQAGYPVPVPTSAPGRYFTQIIHGYVI